MFQYKTAHLSICATNGVLVDPALEHRAQVLIHSPGVCLGSTRVVLHDADRATLRRHHVNTLVLAETDEVAVGKVTREVDQEVRCVVALKI